METKLRTYLACASATVFLFHFCVTDFGDRFYDAGTVNILNALLSLVIIVWTALDYRVMKDRWDAQQKRVATRLAIIGGIPFFGTVLFVIAVFYFGVPMK